MQTPEAQPETTEESNSLGEIKINHTVIASIVRFAALEVSGVCAIASGLVDHLGGIGEIFSKKDLDRGVRVQENAEGRYQIEIRLIMAYGAELGKTAENVQLSIRNQIASMTGKEVSRVDVVIDGVKIKDEKKEAKKAPPQWVETPKTD
jgi:uncharacterized alkaline shock family protein YloU